MTAAGGWGWGWWCKEESRGPLTLEDFCSSAPIRVPEETPCRLYMGEGRWVGSAQSSPKGVCLAQTWDWYSGGGRLVTCAQGGPQETLSNHLYPRILQRDLFIRTGLAGACSLTSLISSVSHSVVSDSLRPHESQHARPPCPSPTPRVHADSHPLSR